MHAEKLLHKRLRDALPDLHLYRLQSLVAAVGGLLRGQQLWSSGLGRHLGGQVSEKHKVKRVDRLLGNAQLHLERRSVYQWMARLLLGQCRHPCVIIDWTDADKNQKLFILRAAVAVGGRALPLYEAVHERCHNAEDTGAFLNHLAALLPPECCPIIVTDAGFRRPWFKAVEALGWYYVGRVRNRDHLRFPGETATFPAKDLYPRATATPRDLGPVALTRSAPFATTATLYYQGSAGRHRLTAQGQRKQSAHSEKHAAREREPWLLVSNLPAQRHRARRIVAIYRDRMTIEEAFRDLKAYRHGFAFRANLGRNAQRVGVLLLIAALGMLVTWLTGLSGIARNLDRGLQANTERRRRVLSTFFIGLRLLRQALVFTSSEFDAAFDELRQQVHLRSYAQA